MSRCLFLPESPPLGTLTPNQNQHPAQESFGQLKTCIALTVPLTRFGVDLKRTTGIF
jgi:hypothetical protein